MPSSDPVDILLAHNTWANRQIIEACGRLTDDQFHRRFEMGPGSLRDTMTHVLGATRRWCDMLSGREIGPRLEDSRHSALDLLSLNDQFGAELTAITKSHPYDQTISGIRGGKPYTFTRGGVIAHVTTHAMHHRAQCLNMLRQIGVNPLPPSAVIEWISMADKK